MGNRGHRLSAACSGHAGRLLVVAVLVAYFGLLGLLGGQSSWDQLGVPDLQPSFADTRSVTSAWECDREGVAVLPTNPCDPYAGGRPANYPTIWLLPSFLGLGQDATVGFGIAIGVIFFASFLVLMGSPGPRASWLFAAVAISPTVMLGVERGNVDLLLFAMVVAAVYLFRRSRAAQAAAYGLLFLAAALKLFPALAWGILVRRPRRLALIGSSAMVGAFAVYVALTFDTILTISDVVPQVIQHQYGADVGIDSLQLWAEGRTGLGWLAVSGDLLTVAAIAAATLVAGILAWQRRNIGELARRAYELPVDAFVAGAGIYVLSFALWHNWDYRLVFLILTIPQLVAWTRRAISPVPAPRLTLAALIGTLWLSQPLTGGLGFWNPVQNFLTSDSLGGLALEEILNWILFVNLGAGLLLTTIPLVGPRRAAAAEQIQAGRPASARMGRELQVATSAAEGGEGRDPTPGSPPSSCPRTASPGRSGR